MLFIVQLRDAFMDSFFGVMCVTSSGIPIYTKQYWLIRLYASVACVQLSCTLLLSFPHPTLKYVQPLHFCICLHL